VDVSALVLALSPGPETTEMALFRGLEPLRKHAAEHGAELRARRVDQRGLRARAVRSFLEDAGVARGGLAAVVGRGGLLRPLEGGTYAICEHLLRDAERTSATVPADPANLGALLAHTIAAEWGCPAFVVDPDSVDERETLARLAQPCTVEPPRAHALAMRAAARRHARAVRRPIESMRLAVVHLGSGASICAHRGGRMVEVIALWGETPWCPRGCGTIPTTALADLDELGHRVTPPVAAPLTAATLADALARAERGDSRATLTLQAGAYRIARAVGEIAAVLEGEVDAVLLTGPLAGAGPIVAEVCRQVEWIAPVFLYREEDDLRALAEGALRVLLGEEPAKRYA
jgi:butyrate kinase